MSKVLQIMEEYSKKIEGQMGIGFRNLRTGEEHYINRDAPFPAASTFKVPLLISLFDQAEKGALSLAQTHTLKDEEIAVGSGILCCLTPGVTLPLRDYAMLMMIVSDNTATDVIYHKVGQHNIQDMIRRMELKNTRCDISCDHLVRIACSIPLDVSSREARALIDGDTVTNEAIYTDLDGPNDISSPGDMVKMFSLIFDGKAVSQKACAEMMEILTECQTNSRIPYWLPESAKVAHKTGTLNSVCCDSGIVTYEDKAYILSLFINGHNASMEERDKNTEQHLYDRLLAELSREIFQAVTE